MSTLATIAVVVGFVAAMISLLSAGIAFAPWVPSSRGAAKRILTLAGFTPGERFVDLGSGDGRVAIAAASLGCIATGVELTRVMYTVSRINAWARRSKATFLRQDLTNYDLSDADIVYVFGTPRGLREKIMSKATKEMKAGSRLVTSTFPMVGWEASTVIPGRRWNTLYLYRR